VVIRRRLPFGHVTYKGTRDGPEIYG